MPLLTLVNEPAVLVLVGLNQLFYRTKLGRWLRAVSDDPVTAQLIGIDNRRIFAIAMGLAPAVCVLAAFFLGIRANFDPSNGPARLIFAFEAVIIGGLGSLWGTLTSGRPAGRRPDIGAAINPEWQLLAGHLVFLPRCSSTRARSVLPEPERSGDDVRARSFPPNSGSTLSTRPTIVVAIAAALVVAALFAAPYWVSRGALRDLFFVLTL